MKVIGKFMEIQQWFYYFSTCSLTALHFLKLFLLLHFVVHTLLQVTQAFLEMHCTGAAYPCPDICVFLTLIYVFPTQDTTLNVTEVCIRI